MTHPQPYTPTFPDRVRTAAYVGTLVVTTTALVVLGVLVVLDVLTPVQALAVMGVVSTACTYVSGGLGTAYRPAPLPWQ